MRLRTPAALIRLGTRLKARSYGWIRARQGSDGERVTLAARRIYILPTSLGCGFAGMLFLMLLGAMNYANNLALGLAFLLGSLGLVAMHHAHRNLAGLIVASRGVEPVFAGQAARFRIALENTARQPRPELRLEAGTVVSAAVRLAAARHDPTQCELVLEIPSEARGRLPLTRFSVATRHPFGLFRAWAVLHMDLECIVYPRPAPAHIAPPPVATETGGAQDGFKGDEDYTGLRPFHPGDPPRRIAWKAYARGLDLHTKVYAGTAVISHVFDFERVPAQHVEERLAQLCRWILDAHAAGRPWGLRLPGQRIEVNAGDGHRQRCLTALALFEATAASRSTATTRTPTAPLPPDATRRPAHA